MADRDGDSIERLARSAPDSRTLRARVVDALRRRVDFEWYVCVLTDPRTCVGVDPLAEVPDGLDLPALVRAKYQTRTHRWTSLGRAAALGADASRSRVWREVQSHWGVRDVLSVVLRDPHGCWGFLDLWSSRPFGREDLRYLDAVSVPLTAGLRRAQARTLRPRPSGEATGPVVLVLDEDLRVRSRTAPVDDWLARLLPPAEGRMPVPAVAFNVAAQLLAVEEGVDDHEPAGRVHLGAGEWVTVRAARLGSAGEIVVTMERMVAAERIDLVSRAFALTPRERGVLAEVCAGRTTAATAAALHLSPLTVQDHLKSAFERTGVQGRRELAALALGAAPPER